MGLPLAMDLGWIATFEVHGSMRPQLSVAAQGGSNTPVPDLSIEGDDLDAAVGGQTGDVLGALEQISEILILLTAATLLKAGSQP